MGGFLMAGEWIKIRTDLPEDPAVYRLSRITGLDRLSVIGRLYAFWSWADKHAVDGRVDGASTLDVDDITRHDGFADAMAKVKWLDIGLDYLAIPKHDRHNGESAKERSLKNARQARWRESKDAGVDAQPSTQKSTKASTREEKRREEKSISEANASGGKPPTNEEIIFSYGLSLLTSAGSTDKAARSFLGGLRKGRDDVDVVNALRDCIRAKPLQPLEWLAAALPPVGSRQKPNAQEALEAQNREVGRRFLEKEALNAPQ